MNVQTLEQLTVMDFCLSLLPVHCVDSLDELERRAIRKWLQAGPKRVIGPKSKGRVRSFLCGALLRAGANIPEEQHPGFTYPALVIKGWKDQMRRSRKPVARTAVSPT